MSKRKRVILVAGARPNFVKVAPILRALDAHGETLPTRLVHAGQHYDAEMSDVFFAQLGIRPPDEHLDVGPGSAGAQTARILERFDEYLQRERDNVRGVVVVGDVNSTMACAVAAAKLEIPGAHVEAGLRSFDRSMPEEINRLVTDAAAEVLFVSEPSGTSNLRAEGAADGRVVYVGNVMIDTLVSELSAARGLDTPRTLGLRPNEYFFATLHRPANVDFAARLESIVGLLERLSQRYPVVFPVHPRTRKSLERYGLAERLDAVRDVRLLEPLGYRECIGLIAGALAVVTDSGGIQEETTYLRVPCLTVRPNTERPSTVTLGTNTLVSGDLGGVDGLIEDVLAGRYKRGGEVPGWDGHAADRIAAELVRRWGTTDSRSR